MKKSEKFIVGAGVAAVLVGLIGFVVLFINAMPKRLDPPVRWVEEIKATGTVARATSKGVEIRFENGKKALFKQTGFTNGQRVLVETRVHFVRSYDVPSPPLAEFVLRSVYPNP